MPVWDLVSDVTRIGEFSPETLEGRWVDGATGPAVGVKFQGHVKRNGRGPMYWTTCRITTCEPEKDFAFVVEAPGMGSGVNTGDTSCPRPARARTSPSPSS